MLSTPEQISGTVDASILDKADRLFRNDDTGMFVELLQNARRAGAKSVEITIEQNSNAPDCCVVTVHDDGEGISDFQKLLTLGHSGWDQDTKRAEDPAGMGFFSLCLSGVEVYSGQRYARITREVFLGKANATVEAREECVRGTRLVFPRWSSKGTLKVAIERVTSFCPIEVRLDGDELPRHDFLEGALYRESIDGIEVGFALMFVHSWSPYGDENWNFYGARIRQDVSSLNGFPHPKRPDESLQLAIRFNVLQTGRVSLQLPDRRAIIQDEPFKEFLRKVRLSELRFFLQQSHHFLPFNDWKQAQELGVILPEAATRLRTWEGLAADSDGEQMFGEDETRIVTDLTPALLIDSIPDVYTLQGALCSGSPFPYTLYRQDPALTGYSWYDALPKLVDTDVLIDGMPVQESQVFTEGQKRPVKIDVHLTIEQACQEQRTISIPAFIHLEDSNSFIPEFVAVERSPWDNDELSGPFSITDFLVYAGFIHSDDSESDSWQTQLDYYVSEVEQLVNEYFRGPRATLIAVLRKSLSFDLLALATKLNVTHINFTRADSNEHSWNIELSDSGGQVI